MADEVVFLEEDNGYLQTQGTPVVTFLNDYECPRCGSLLSAEDRPTDCWLVCPECGRPREPEDSDRPVELGRAVNAPEGRRSLDGLAEPTFGEKLASLPYFAVLGILFFASLFAAIFTSWVLKAEPVMSGIVFILLFPALAILFRPKRQNVDAD